MRFKKPINKIQKLFIADSRKPIIEVVMYTVDWIGASGRQVHEKLLVSWYFKH